MAPSSSGSWPGAPGDIIDLDRYMRGNVRPSRPLADDTKCERLVVDGGGCASSRSSGSAAVAAPRFKHASHDSGVSDGSYRRERRHNRARRRATRRASPIPFPPPPCEPALTRTLSGQTNSLRAFRTVCEQALLGQQQQIARVTELCERLAEKTERAEKVEQSERKAEKATSELDEQKKQPERAKKPEAASSGGTSEISSSSRSTKYRKQKSQKYQQECKTYKIIMNKLDELSRVLPPRAAPRPPLPSCSSVSVCDKRVATDPPPRRYNTIITPSHQRKCSVTSPPRQGEGAPPSPQLPRERTVTRVFAVDIAPGTRLPRAAHNVVTESIVKCESRSESLHHSACDVRCGFDLDDPVHLYSQAKRLHSMTCSSRHARSSGAVGAAWAAHVRQQVREQAGARGEQARAPSLCAVCRGYWRYLRRCVPPLERAPDSCRCS